MCSSPHWQVGLSWFREKLSPANREQRLSRWADFAKNCLPRIGSKELPRFREKYRALERQKNGVQHATAIYPIPRCTRPQYIGLTLYSLKNMSVKGIFVFKSLMARRKTLEPLMLILSTLHKTWTNKPTTEYWMTHMYARNCWLPLKKQTSHPHIALMGELLGTDYM